VSRPNRPCRVCGKAPGVAFEVSARRRGIARVWSVEVCRDCWRVFEAMLEEGCRGMQPQLTASGRNALWFL
jgi:hypothetical protein